MKHLLLFLTLADGSAAAAGLDLVPAPPAAVFGGGTREIQLALRNTTTQSVAGLVQLQVLQASSATVIPLGPAADWKELTVLPRQTIRESASLALPTVRRPTRFLVRFTQRNTMLGSAELWAYPSNQLVELETLLDKQPLLLAGVSAECMESLTLCGVPTLAWTEADPPPSVKLAVFGPGAFPAGGDARMEAITRLTKAGTGVIWIKLTAWPDSAVEPAYFVIPAGEVSVVVAQSGSLTNLATDPWAQRRLLRMARLAIGRERPAWPAHGSDSAKEFP